MWFKNLKIYRLAPGTILAALQAGMENYQFHPCDSQQAESVGWVPVRPDCDLLYTLGGQYLLLMCIEKKLLPASVVNAAAAVRAERIEQEQGYRPGRKQMKEIKEQVTLDLLPKAFTVHQFVPAWIDAVNRWAVVDASSDAKSDVLLGLLAKTISPFPLVPFHVEVAPARAMTEWLVDDDEPAGFSVDQDAELQNPGESRATVRYSNQTLAAQEALQRVHEGKQCTRLAMTWNDRISFVLTDSLDVRRVKPLDVLREKSDAQNEAEQFDSDFALMTGELARLLDDLGEALGGEKTGAESEFA
ncbi:recombination-associated protein RdgC [Castellaniella sp. FW104-16D08]|uniref:recombination-associated protein RdgC n=1 Tax=unclassified Castellaniella TaxID=2617606 RepID=UPI003314BB7B